MSDVPTLSEVLDAAIRGGLDDVRVCLPGKITAYDAATRRATVQVLAMDGYTGEDGARKTSTLPPLTDVPVAHYGSGAVRIKVPVRAGDRCWLMFASSSIARLKAGATGVYDPGDDRHHSLADAIALPLVVVGEDEADAMIEFTSTEIRCGGTEPLVTKAEFEAHTHPDPASGFTGPPTDPITGTSKLRG